MGPIIHKTITFIECELPSAMSIPLRVQRLKEDRKNWNRNKPFGFSAGPVRNQDGTNDLGKWRVLIPGPPKTPWEDGRFQVFLTFPQDYPRKPPTARFKPVIFHPNVYTDGQVCLTLINPDNWAASTSVSDIVHGLQTFLAEPNENDPANSTAGAMYKNNRSGYINKVRKYVLSIRE